MFTNDQLAAFNTQGFVRLPSAVPADDIRDMRQRLWLLLEQKGARRDDPSTWRPGYGSRLHAIRRGDPDPKASPELCAALDAVFAGEDWHVRADWGQALVTFPNWDQWTVPKHWHLDHPFRQTERISGVNMLLFVDDVAAGGGGTVAVQSSPQLVGRFMASAPGIEPHEQGKLKRRFIQSHPWLRELTGKPERSDRNDRLMKEGTDVDGIPVRVVELVGSAGDVILCHPWLLHGGAPNASNKPRLMRASRIYRRRSQSAAMAEKHPEQAGTRRTEQTSSPSAV